MLALVIGSDDQTGNHLLSAYLAPINPTAEIPNNKPVEGSGTLIGAELGEMVTWVC